jgi:hypothetical protein
LSDDEVTHCEVVVLKEPYHGHCAIEFVALIFLRLKFVAVFVASHGGGHVRELRIQKVVALDGELVVGNFGTSIVDGGGPFEFHITTDLIDAEGDHTRFSGAVHG